MERTQGISQLHFQGGTTGPHVAVDKILDFGSKGSRSAGSGSFCTQAKNHKLCLGQVTLSLPFVAQGKNEWVSVMEILRSKAPIPLSSSIPHQSLIGAENSSQA